MSVCLVIIDPQNDFCSKDGSLYVPGADEDCLRIAKFISTNKDKIDTILLTLDSHPAYHIAHPIFWIDENGKNPEPYTVITYQQVNEGKWKPADSKLSQKAEDYLLELETKGHYNLIVWPPHCLTATKGYCVNESIIAAVREWESFKPGRNAIFVTKTSSPFTEHYSAVQAEVPINDDPSTRVNFSFIDILKAQDEIYFVGEAFSHCVSNTLRDLVTYIPSDRMTLLKDCMSNVAGYEKLAEALMKEFGRQGMKISNSLVKIIS